MVTRIVDHPPDLDHEMPKGRKREKQAETDEPASSFSSRLFAFSPFRGFAIRRVPLVVEGVLGGVALLAENPIGRAIAGKHCLLENAENPQARKQC